MVAAQFGVVTRAQLLAAVLSCGSEAALSHTSATALHDVREEGPRTHVSVPRSPITAEPTTSAAPPSSANGNATWTAPPSGSRHSA